MGVDETDEQGAVPEQQGGVEGEARRARGRGGGGGLGAGGAVGSGGGTPGCRRRLGGLGGRCAGLEEEAASTGSGEE